MPLYANGKGLAQNVKTKKMQFILNYVVHSVKKGQRVDQSYLLFTIVPEIMF